MGGTATLRHSTCNAVRPREENRCATLEGAQQEERRAWGGQPRFGRAQTARCGREREIVAKLGSVQREEERSVGGTATRRQSACNAVRPRKENCCDAWEGATEGRAERGRDPTATLRPSTSSAVRPRKESRCEAWKRAAGGREERGGGAHASAEHVQRSAAEEGDWCDAWERETEGRGERGRDSHASAGHEQRGAAERGKSLRSLEACNGGKRRAWEGRLRVGRARAAQCGREG